MRHRNDNNAPLGGGGGGAPDSPPDPSGSTSTMSTSCRHAPNNAAGGGWVCVASLLAYLALLIVLESALHEYNNRGGSSTMIKPVLAAAYHPGDAVSGGGGDEFVEFDPKRSQDHLRTLTGFGPRTVGSRANEVDAANWLMEEIAAVARAVSDARGGRGGRRTDDIIQPSSWSLARLDFERQSASGALWHEPFMGSFTCVYRNVTNVIARLSWGGGARDAVLINAHFDSAPGSPGGSDDGVGIAVMLEALRVLALGIPVDGGALTLDERRTPVRPLRDVIFLFNGAEETNTQASHGFMSSHRWAQSVSHVINLEAMGGGGREFVFQCNSAAIAALYGRVSPSPRGSVVGHEFFKHGLSRGAATDFKVFTEMGPPRASTPIGVDTVYTENGYIYHTSFDDSDAVPLQTFRNTGANVIELARAMMMVERRDDDGDSGVFFDFLGVLWFAYGARSAVLIHGLSAVAGLIASHKALGAAFAAFEAAPREDGKNDVSASHDSAAGWIWSQLRRELLVVVAAVITGGAVGAIVAFVCPMHWYAGGVGPAVMLFAPSALATTLFVRGRFVNREIDARFRRVAHLDDGCRSGLVETSLLAGSVALLSALLLPLAMIGIHSAYLLVPWCLSGALLCVLHTYDWYTFSRRHLGGDGGSRSSTNSSSDALVRFAKRLRWRLLLPARKSVLTLPFACCGSLVKHALCVAPAVLMWAQLAHTVLMLVVPLLGKAGTVVSSDIVLSMLIALLVALGSGVPLAPLHARAPDETAKLTRALAAFSTIAVLLLQPLFTSPYSEARPKRLWLQHVGREWRTTNADGSVAERTNDAGIWLMPFDSQSLAPLSQFSPHFDGRHEVQCNRRDGSCFEQLPYYYAVPDMISGDWFLPVERRAVVPASEELVFQHDVSVVALALPGSGDTDFFKRVDVFLSGPPHMALTILDGTPDGSRLVDWTLPIAPPSHSRVTIRGNLEGAHYIQLSSGGPCGRDQDAGCEHHFSLFFSDPSRVVVLSASAHYLGVTNTPELDALYQELPAWAKGAEWVKACSTLISVHC